MSPTYMPSPLYNQTRKIYQELNREPQNEKPLFRTGSGRNLANHPNVVQVVGPKCYTDKQTTKQAL